VVISNEAALFHWPLQQQQQQQQQQLGKPARWENQTSIYL